MALIIEQLGLKRAQIDLEALCFLVLDFLHVVDWALQTGKG